MVGTATPVWSLTEGLWQGCFPACCCSQWCGSLPGRERTSSHCHSDTARRGCSRSETWPGSNFTNARGNLGRRPTRVAGALVASRSRRSGRAAQVPGSTSPKARDSGGARVRGERCGRATATDSWDSRLQLGAKTGRSARTASDSGGRGRRRSERAAREPRARAARLARAGIDAGEAGYREAREAGKGARSGIRPNCCKGRGGH